MSFFSENTRDSKYHIYIFIYSIFRYEIGRFVLENRPRFGAKINNVCLWVGFYRIYSYGPFMIFSDINKWCILHILCKNQLDLSSNRGHYCYFTKHSRTRGKKQCIEWPIFDRNARLLKALQTMRLHDMQGGGVPRNSVPGIQMRVIMTGWGGGSLIPSLIPKKIWPHIKIPPQISEYKKIPPQITGYKKYLGKRHKKY